MHIKCSFDYSFTIILSLLVILDLLEFYVMGIEYDTRFIVFVIASHVQWHWGCKRINLCKRLSRILHDKELYDTNISPRTFPVKWFGIGRVVRDLVKNQTKLQTEKIKKLTVDLVSLKANTILFDFDLLTKIKTLTKPNG